MWIKTNENIQTASLNPQTLGLVVAGGRDDFAELVGHPVDLAGGKQVERGESEGETRLRGYVLVRRELGRAEEDVWEHECLKECGLRQKNERGQTQRVVNLLGDGSVLGPACRRRLRCSR